MMVASQNADWVTGAWSEGQRVECKGHCGTLCYYGSIPGTKGNWVGIDWDDPARGKHDGTYNGCRYFQARLSTSGSFVRPETVNLGQSFIDAFQNRYQLKFLPNKEGLQEIQNAIKAPFLQLVGFDKMSEIDKLSVVGLENLHITTAGGQNEVGQLCPNVLELNMSNNLFNSWHSIAEIAAQLKLLSVLNISSNRLPLPEEPEQLRAAFQQLDHIVMGRMGYTWGDVLHCAAMFPQITILQVPFNDIATLTKPDVLENLYHLDLQCNAISDWAQIMKLGSLPRLHYLNVSSNCINEVWLPENKSVFPVLRQLHLSNNIISSWKSLNELDKLVSLEELAFKDNPVLKEFNWATCRQLIIARIGNLKEFDKEMVLREERVGAEVDYIKRHGRAWLDSAANDALRQNFLLLHPRYPALVHKYGPPEESELKVVSMALKNNLINLEIFNEEKTIKKRLPIHMLVQRVIGLVQRFFNMGTNVPLLYCISVKNSNQEILLDNPLKSLYFYSVEDGDKILVRFEGTKS